MLRFPGPLVHGQGGGEGLQQDVVEHAGEEGVGQDSHREQRGSSSLYWFLLNILLLPFMQESLYSLRQKSGLSPKRGTREEVRSFFGDSFWVQSSDFCRGELNEAFPESLELPLSDVFLPEDHREEETEADQARGRTDPT